MVLTRRFRLTVAYEGTAYGGWQVQEGVTTVQGVLERAAEDVNGEPTRILGAGRTDAGTHARGQIALFPTGRDLEAHRVPRALGAYLPEDIVVTAAVEVGEEFHPVRDALARHYRYTLKQALHDDPFDRRFVHRVATPLDVRAMAQAAAHLPGRRDFAPFQNEGSPRRDTVRTLQRLDLVAEGDYIHIDFTADGFLYGMARNLAGMLLRVGQGALDPAVIPAALEAGDRSLGGPTLPAAGLCLMEVRYPPAPGSIPGRNA
ncbi:MAG: tRNA pseudouridine(38-40) synthase TruA [Planctomycetaceae bacterium]